MPCPPPSTPVSSSKCLGGGGGDARHLILLLSIQDLALLRPLNPLASAPPPQQGGGGRLCLPLRHVCFCIGGITKRKNEIFTCKCQLQKPLIPSAAFCVAIGLLARTWSIIIIIIIIINFIIIIIIGLVFVIFSCFHQVNVCEVSLFLCYT